MNKDKTIICVCIVTGHFLLNLFSGIANAQNHTAEIFIGDDKGVGQSGIIFTLTEGDNEIVVPTSDLTSGAHLLSIRVQDEEGRFTPTVSRMIYVCDAAGIQGCEYFIDTDPGNGNGTFLPDIKSGTFDFEIPTAGIAIGPHTLTLRTLNTNGNLDSGISRAFIVTANNVEIEWFYDKDPGVGNGNRITAESDQNILMLPTEGLSSGAHTLSMRVKDSQNRWTPTVTHPLYITEPVEEVVGGEYFIDEDPGEGNATGFGLSDDGINSFIIPTDNLAVGTHYLTIRFQTDGGKWIPLHVAPFEVSAYNGVNIIEWKMNFNVQRTESTITIHGTDIPSNSSIDVISISGIYLHKGKWTDSNLPYIIDIDESEKHPVIIITSPEGLKTTKRIR